MSSLLDAANASWDDFIIGKLPTKPGKVSLMTIQEFCTALGCSTDKTNGIADPSPGYNTSTYFVYGIAGIEGENSARGNLRSIGISWYKQLNKPTTKDDYWMVGDYKVFGGPFELVHYEGNDSDYGDRDSYYFDWLYMEKGGNNWSADSDYWGCAVAGYTFIAVVCADDTAISEASNTTEASLLLPTKPGDVSIITLEQAHDALFSLAHKRREAADPSGGYDTSTYYIYAINDTPGSSDAMSASTKDNLQSIDFGWYKQLNKPSTDRYWMVGNHKLFGGPLFEVDYYDRAYYFFYWYCHHPNSECDLSASEDHWSDLVPGSVYVAIVRAHE